MTNSGVEITDTEIGEGELAAAGDVLTVHYTGWLSDGTEFDSSVGRGDPFTFKLGAGQVIAGWDVGMVGMAPGGSRRLTIPADLAYGDRGAGSAIPPGAELVFEVKLISISR